MLYEKKKILIHRLVTLILLILGIIIPIIIANIPAKEAELIDDSGYINYYYEDLDSTSCEIEVVFNCTVNSGYITVAFYDSSDKLLLEEERYFYGYDNTLSSTFYVDGYVDSYEIISYDVSETKKDPYIMIRLFIIGDTIVFIFFIASLTYAYKEYEYNGNIILVYAGEYHHYIKVNGIKTDEHNTAVSYTAIPLSCTLDDDTDIKVTITMSNRITLKINNKLYTKTK